MALTLRSVALVLLGVIPAVIWPSAVTVWLWVLLCALLIVLDVLLAAPPDQVGLTRRPPVAVRLGESSATSLVVSNDTGRRLRGLLRDAWPPSAGAEPARHTLDLPPGERTRVTTTLTPIRRGDRPADRVTVRSLGPMRLAGRQRSVTVPGSLRALHPFPARRHLPSRLAVLRQLDGRAAVRVRGQGTEFDSLRDYVDGDDVRSIDWRATARRQSLVVRTWQPEQHRRVIIVLDTSRTSAGRVDDQPRLDAAMDAALLLTALAGHARDRVTILAGDRSILARVSGHDRAELLHDAISTLAPVDARLIEADWSLLATEIARHTSQRALVVLLTPLEPAPFEQGLLPVLPALTARHLVVVASVADPEVARLQGDRSGEIEAYAAAAAEHSVALRQRTAAALRSLGVEVLDAVPDELPVRLVDHYLMLKRLGRL